MSNEKLIIAIDGHIKNTDEIIHRWGFVYVDGILEEDYGFNVPLFNQPMPKEEGYYIAYTEDKNAVIINLVFNETFGIMNGRCCYIDDYEALVECINDPESWY